MKGREGGGEREGDGEDGGRVRGEENVCVKSQ